VTPSLMEKPFGDNILGVPWAVRGRSRLVHESEDIGPW
jgi:hypothetical protein